MTNEAYDNLREGDIIWDYEIVPGAGMVKKCTVIDITRFYAGVKYLHNGNFVRFKRAEALDYFSIRVIDAFVMSFEKLPHIWEGYHAMR